MITTVLLHGELGKRFGRKHEFDLCCAKEAVEAMEMARPGFKQAIARMRKHVFRVRVGKKYIMEDRLLFPNNGKTIAITPILEGAASSKGIFQIIAGVVLIAAGFIVGPESSFYGALLLGGASLALGGVASLLSPAPPQTQQDAKNSASYIFNEAVNTTQQGGAIQFVLGYPFHGTQIISADVVPQDIAIGSEGEVNPGDGDSIGGSGPNEPAHPAYAH